MSQKSNPTETLPRTSIAAVTWTHNDQVTHVRVYTQDINGGIRESRYDGQSWSGGTAQDVIAQAKPNSPISAFRHWDIGLIHVYYLNTENIIQEMYLDWNSGKWNVGDINDAKIKASPVSSLASLGYNNDIYCTIFYQQPSGTIGHLNRVRDDQGRSKKWIQVGAFGDKPLIGTRLAALAFHESSSVVRVYYQQSNGTVVDVGVDKSGSYQQGDLKLKDVPPNVSLSAFAVGDNPDNTRYQLYFINHSNWVSEGGYYGGEWHFENHPGETHAAAGGNIAALIPKSQLLRVYFQNETNQIVEYSSTEAWTDWKENAVIPTGNVQ